MFTAKVSEKSIGKKRQMRLLAVLLVPAVALIFGGAVSDGWAQPDCFFNIEFNATDLDVGVRGFFDDDPWRELEIENPRGRTISEDESRRGLKRQGKAEWFFESGEPPLTEVSFRKFLRRFPEGDYIFEAELIDGDEAECIAEFTHVIPCPPVIVKNPFDNDNRTIEWAAVTTAVNTEATDDAVEISGLDAEVVCFDNGPVVIEGYEVIVEGENGDLSITLPADATSFEVPAELGGFFKFEVLAIEESGNQTITEVEQE
ncbi:MAG: hypothetical protein PVI71_14180, partial [Desulfobacterales bacterium]|jgi:hypothetical protein